MNFYENWLGQVINVGDIVFNGQRDGNTSTFRYGKVKSFNTTKSGNLVARVEWIAERGGAWTDSEYVAGPVVPYVKASSLDPDNLVVVDPSVVHTTKFVSKTG